MAVPNISEFRAKLKFGGARTNLFKVKITNPAVGGVDSDLAFRATSTDLPAWTVTPIQVFYHGRSIKVAGNRQFADWTVNIINDEDFNLRNAFETWSNKINSVEGNVRTFGTSEQSLYKSIGEVTQMSQTGADLRTYRMNGIFPIDVGQIAVDWSNDNVQYFPVTFSLDYFTIETSATGNAGGK